MKQKVGLKRDGVGFRTNFLPSISYWFYGTITGITGILLVAIMSIIYVFSAPAVLKQAYHAFRVTHLLNILLYALTILHGLPKLLDVSFLISPFCLVIEHMARQYLNFCKFTFSVSKVLLLCYRAFCPVHHRPYCWPQTSV